MTTAAAPTSVAAAPLRSRLYQCRIAHERFSPKHHRFAYRVFYLAIDLDELPELDRRLRLLSVNRGNLYSIHEADFLPTDAPAFNPTRAGDTLAGGGEAAGPGALRRRLDAFLAARGVATAGARAELVALPRMLGYLFNPVCFYFVRDADDRPVAAIAEVTNTFREVKLYLLGPGQWRDGAFRLRVPKHFYVSPYSDVDVEFDFALRPAGESLAARIDDYEGGKRTFTSALTGAAVPLTDARLALHLFTYPLLTLRVTALIHWHALLLLWKKVPWFRKAARAADQRDLHHPHASIAGIRPTSP